MKGFYTILLLIVSNVFMTFALVRTFKDETGVQLVRSSSADRCDCVQLGDRLLNIPVRYRYNRIGFIGNGYRFH